MLRPVLLLLTMSILHLHAVLMPLFVISAPAEHKCQERSLLIPAKLVLEQSCASTPVWHCVEIFLLMTVITV